MSEAANWTTFPCPAPSSEHRRLAEARQTQLTKPAGSLGRLEHLAIELAALQATERPRAETAPIIIFAGDHGVTAQGVSAFPSEVTVQMLANFAAGGAAIAVLARALGQSLTVIDAGTLAEASIPGVLVDRPCRGTRDFTLAAALTPAERDHALGCGKRAIERTRGENPDLVVLGEMGIGNTTAAAAIICALTGEDPMGVAGAGTGLDDAGRRHKAEVIDRALKLHGLRGPAAAPDPQHVLCAVGGLEIAALTGAIIAAAQNRTPILIDGFIVSACALAAARINPSCRPWLIFSHASAERGHRIALDALNARPLLDLELRLGEASGAATALSIVQLACALHNSMATFQEAAVSQRSEPC